MSLQDHAVCEVVGAHADSHSMLICLTQPILIKFVRRWRTHIPTHVPFLCPLDLWKRWL